MHQPNPTVPSHHRVLPSPALVLRSLMATTLLLGAASCSVHFNGDLQGHDAYNYNDDIGPTTLVARVEENGSTAKYSIAEQSRRFPSGSGSLVSAILVSRESTLELPFLGLDVRSVDTESAKDLGMEAWRGVLVSKVEKGSAAAGAGLRRTDLLLSVNGVALMSDAQFTDVVSGSLSPGDEVEFEVSRMSSEFVREELVVPLVVGGRTIEETEADRVDLQLNEYLVHRTGLGVATVPAELAGEIYGTSVEAVLVTAVVTGSSAYLAGFRTGDRILQASGVPVNTTLELRELVERESDRLVIVADGLLGAHSGVIDLSEDVMKTSDFGIPIVVNYEARPDRTRLSVLDFIFQFGFNKRTDYHLSSTRKSKKSSSLSILPLGMFEFKRTPTRSTNRIFWLIKWSSKR
ncbi:MAG: hypothetical protein ACJAZN_003004 [Planctomycetota bacterium]|jgi:hypothetical protein